MKKFMEFKRKNKIVQKLSGEIVGAFGAQNFMHFIQFMYILPLNFINTLHINIMLINEKWMKEMLALL